MTLNLRAAPEWLATVLLAEDDTEESVVGSDLHQEAIAEAHGPLARYAAEIGTEGAPAWYVSNQVTVITPLPERTRPWKPKPDLFVVPGIPAHSRSSYDTRTEGPMPPFVLEVVSESTWQNDVGEKSRLYGLTGVREYLVFDPTREYLGRALRGWHVADGAWVDWAPTQRPDGTDVWESSVLGLAVRPEGLFVRFDHPEQGPLPLRRELYERLAEQQMALAEERRAREEAERRLAALQSELRRLRGE